MQTFWIEKWSISDKQTKRHSRLPVSTSVKQPNYDRPLQNPNKSSQLCMMKPWLNSLLIGETVRHHFNQWGYCGSISRKLLYNIVNRTLGTATTVIPDTYFTPLSRLPWGLTSTMSFLAHLLYVDSHGSYSYQGKIMDTASTFTQYRTTLYGINFMSTVHTTNPIVWMAFYLCICADLDTLTPYKKHNVVHFKKEV